jgi:methionyl-tRNA synthetase
MKEKLLVTSALPYANGAIHFGHIAGAYLPADIYVRYHRLKGNDVIYICGTDEHGTAITFSAMKAKRTPQEHVDHFYQVIKGIFDKFNIRFDNFSRTTKPKHYDLSQQFFLEILDNKYIEKRTNKQLYCENDKMYLPDRYVGGTCPHCHYENARGDECPNCGAWIDQTTLIEPKCKLCGNTPVIKETSHWHIELGKMTPMLEKYVQERESIWKDNVKGFVKGMLKEGLKERAITRDLEWGVPVPLDEAEGKVLYVWFDAPIGYISSTAEWAEVKGEPDLWKDYWQNPDCKIVHFIGKDNIVFHCLIWPAMLMAQKQPFELPYNVPANEFLNLQGRQFSKSEGWYIELDEFFNTYPTDSIRYYLTTIMPEKKDSDFSWKEFQHKHNGELADTLGNLVNRSLTFIRNKLGNKIPPLNNPNEYDEQVLDKIKTTPKIVGTALSNYEFRKAAFEIMELARLGNKYYDEKKPWASLKQENLVDCNNTLYITTQLIKTLAIISYPIIPETSSKIWKMLNLYGDVSEASWDDTTAEMIPEEKEIGELTLLFTKIDDAQIDKEIEKLESNLKEKEQAGKKQYDPIKDQIVYDDFAKLDLRVGLIKSAEKVKKADKLLKLIVDIGIEERQLLAGIAKTYKPEELIGKRCIVVANLQPRKMRGIESQGMVLAASYGDEIRIVEPNPDVEVGGIVS